jgi:hypothetical protein
VVRVQVGGGRSLGGRIFGSLFYLIFVGAGLFMTAMFARAWWQGARSYAWDRSECTVVESAYAANPEGSSSERFRTTVRYRYDWQGTQYEGTVERTFSDATEAQVFRDDYPPEARVRCFVDPREPAESRLRRPSPFSILILLFPLIFVGAGGLPLYLTWRREPAEPVTPKARPLTEPAKKSSLLGGCIMAGFFGVFFLAGAGVLWWLMLGPLYKISKAQSWESTPCTVVSSQLGSQSDSDGSTYRVEVLYRYAYGGREYESSRYDFETAYSSGSAPKQAIVDRFVAGEACTCFVDPAEPARSVLNRDFHKSYWAGLVGLPFLLVGLFGLLWVSGAFSAAGTKKKQPPVAARREFSSWREAAAPLRLRPKSGPWKKLLGSLFVNLFWNGIVTVFVVLLSREWRAGNHEWMPILILTPFVLIGLMLVLGLPYSVLALLNPRPWIELDRASVGPGESTAARYRLSGSSGRVGQLTIVLEGREAVTVTTHSGNSTTVSRREGLFHRSVLFDSGPGGAPREAAFTFAVPAGVMHSFTSPNNGVHWKIKVHGDIPRFPDLDQEFEIEVPPAEVTR